MAYNSSVSFFSYVLYFLSSFCLCPWIKFLKKMPGIECQTTKSSCFQSSKNHYKHIQFLVLCALYVNTRLKLQAVFFDEKNVSNQWTIKRIKITNKRLTTYISNNNETKTIMTVPYVHWRMYTYNLRCSIALSQKINIYAGNSFWN